MTPKKLLINKSRELNHVNTCSDKGSSVANMSQVISIAMCMIEIRMGRNSGVVLDIGNLHNKLIALAFQRDDNNEHSLCCLLH